MRLSWKALTIIFAVLLGISIALVVILFSAVSSFYRDVHLARLNPLGLERYGDQSTNPDLETVVFFGDSRAQQWPAPDGMARFEFINRGIGGQTSAQVAARFDAHVRPLSPAVIVLQMCVNDLKTIPLFPDLRENIVAACQSNIEQVIAQAQEIGAKVIVTTIFPVGDVPLVRQLFWSDDVPAIVREVNDWMPGLARDGVVVLDTDPLLADNEGLLRDDLSIDELHLNDVGYAILNKKLLEQLLADTTQPGD